VGLVIAERYARYAIERTQTSGASAQEIEATKRRMAGFTRMYDNPLTTPRSRSSNRRQSASLSA
jgi:hypothetical protein